MCALLFFPLPVTTREHVNPSSRELRSLPSGCPFRLGEQLLELVYVVKLVRQILCRGLWAVEVALEDTRVREIRVPQLLLCFSTELLVSLQERREELTWTQNEVLSRLEECSISETLN